ncbi:hypothetical protein [Verrucomicrobium sp. BvORR106]|uniref:hypothetical protein n=1 Tax=Verrucomicrobium sp. BvORR106 TaxID=1403819 RepID=UPI00056EC806|nr:hypothetical protein [Verrucomicrobium sp. BvORR106]
MITRFAQLPLEISTKALQPHAKPGEPIVTMRMLAVGNLSAFRMGGRTNRVFRFEYSRALSCHVLSVPLSLWQMDKLALAREALDQRLMHSIIVDVEVPVAAPEQTEPPAPAPQPAPQAPGAPAPEGNGDLVVSNDTKVPEVPSGDGKSTVVPDIAKVRAVFEESRPARLKRLADELDIDPEVLRALVETEGSGLVIKSGGWVDFTEPPAPAPQPAQ